MSETNISGEKLHQKTFVRTLHIDAVEKDLHLHQYVEGDVNCVVWDAAIVLAKYLEELYKKDKTSFLNKNFLELGSGLGCVGLTAACLGYDKRQERISRFWKKKTSGSLSKLEQYMNDEANVTLTDLPEALPLLELNLKVNSCSTNGNKTEVVSLAWGKNLNNIVVPDVILLADCIYYKESIEPLIKTLKKLADTQTKILLSQEMRDSVTQRNNWQNFLECVRQEFFVKEIPLSEQNKDFCSSDILLLQLKKR